MHIISAGSAFPPFYYRQQQICEALKRHWGNKLPSVEALSRLLSRVGVSGRHLSLPIEQYDGLDSWGKSNDVWIRTAEELGQQALCRALTRAGLGAQDIDAIYFVSVTGIASPSIDARLVNRMGLRPDIKRIPIFGLGCVAGAAGIARAADYVRAFPDHVAALVSVELCSLTWQRNDVSVANLISSGLFGDGAGSVLVCGAKHPAASGPGPCVLDTRSSFYPDTQEVMGWDISEEGFRIVLSPDVPSVVYENLGTDVDGFLASNGLQRNDIQHWVMHTGGPKVLEATSAALELPDDALDASWACLDRVGNLSSASVLLVLESFLQRKPTPGSYGLLAAMGPGFCSELVLLQW